MRLERSRFIGGVALWAAIVGSTAAVHAQDGPWQFRTDAVTLVDCAVINAENLEMIVLNATDELVIVSEDGIDVDDTVVFDSAVDATGNIFLSGVQVGQIRFAEDANGTTTMWWLDTFTDRIYHYDRATDQPTLGVFTPTDIVGLGCDPCTVWDVPEDCGIVVDEPGDPSQPDVPGIPVLTINICGMNSAMSLMLTFAGLVGTGLVRGPLGRRH